MKRILISGPNFKTPVNETYFNIKIRQLFERMYTSVESYDIVEQQINYIRAAALCSKSSKAFQYFYDITQQLMIDNNYPAAMQTYLDRFLFDVRLQMPSIDDFCQMYEPNLYYHVKILTDFQYGKCNLSNDSAGEIVRSVLVHLKCKDLRRFVILVTHFEAFRYLLDALKR